MKKWAILYVFISVVFCACAKEENKEIVPDSGSGAVVNGTTVETEVSGSAVTESVVSGGVSEEVREADSNSNSDSDEMMIMMAGGNGPMLSEKVDQTRKGIEMIYNSWFATGLTKGDDGNCYYFRYQKGKKGEGTVTFYRNNAIKVCETVLPEKYEKDDYFITGFFKQGERFWVHIESGESQKEFMVPVLIKNGKWGKGIKLDCGLRLIFYKNCFYSFYKDEGTVDITDINGNRKRLVIKEEGQRATLQIIVDDKLYYTMEEKENDTREYTVMRCNMDGSNKEELFRYGTVPSTSMNKCKLTMDGEYLYLFDPYCEFTLTRIPLYGGKIEKIVETDWYDLTEDSIYYLDKKGNIRRINKSLKGKPKLVMKSNKCQMGDIPFLCADGHLLVEGYNKKERRMINIIWTSESMTKYLDIGMNYSNEYYWISENGKVEDKIPGSGLGSKYRKWYEEEAKYLEKYGDD